MLAKLPSVLIISSSVDLMFVTAPDHEVTPVYTSTVTISDGTYSVEQDITITIHNVLEDVISESFEIINGTDSSPPRITSTLELDALTKDKSIIGRLLDVLVRSC
jgi:hypothetical protein